MKYFFILLTLCFFTALGPVSAFAKTDVHLIKQGNVTAGDEIIDTAPIIPIGKVIKLKKFGCLAPVLQATTWSYVVLQWGSSGDWETIRACYGATEYMVMRDFTGDGAKQFRIIRRNKSTTVALDMAAWVEALVKD